MRLLLTGFASLAAVAAVAGDATAHPIKALLCCYCTHPHHATQSVFVPQTAGASGTTFGATGVTFGAAPVTFGATPVSFGATPITFGAITHVATGTQQQNTSSGGVTFGSTGTGVTFGQNSQAGNPNDQFGAIGATLAAMLIERLGSNLLASVLQNPGRPATTTSYDELSRKFDAFVNEQRGVNQAVMKKLDDLNAKSDTQLDLLNKLTIKVDAIKK